MTKNTKDEASATTPSTHKPVCFVMMPIADVSNYEPGHFNRVYEYLIKPAIEAAGFDPYRADDTAKRII